MSQFIALGMPSGATWIVIAAIGLILFGKRLPEVGRSLGKGIVEFKKGLTGVADEIRQVDPTNTPTATVTTTSVPAQQPLLGETVVTSASAEKPAVKFDPYTGKPIENSATPQT